LCPDFVPVASERLIAGVIVAARDRELAKEREVSSSLGEWT